MLRVLILVLLILSLAPHGARGQSLDEIRSYIRHEEGCRLYPYIDTMGYWTIGVGHKVNHAGRAISKDECDALLNEDVTWAVMAALRLTPHFESHPKAVRLMIIGLVFNLGPTGYSDLRTFRAALDRHDYILASERLAHTAWARQLPARAARYEAVLSSL